MPTPGFPATRGMLLGLAATTSSCLTSGMDLEASGAWFAPEVSGEIQLQPTASTTLEEVDLNSDLDLDDDSTFQAGARLGVIGFNLVASAFETSQDGRGTLSAPFGDIPTGSDIASSMDMFNVQGALTFNLIDIPWVRIAPGVGVDYLDVEVAVRELNSGLEESVEGSGPIPLVYLEGAVSPPLLPLELLIQVGGIAGDYGDFDGSLLDGQAYLRWQVADPVELYAGYRLLLFELDGVHDDRDFTSDFDLEGFVVGAGFRF